MSGEKAWKTSRERVIFSTWFISSVADPLHEQSQGTHTADVHLEVHPQTSALSPDFLATNVWILLWGSYLIAFSCFLIFLCKLAGLNILFFKSFNFGNLHFPKKLFISSSLQFYLHRDQQTEKADLWDLSFLHSKRQQKRGSLPVCPFTNLPTNLMMSETLRSLV